MTNFDADTLRELRDVREVAIRTEEHPKTTVVIWVMVANDEVFVRSWRGTKGRWYRASRRAARHLEVCRAPAGGAGDPGERAHGGRPGHPRISAEVPSELACPGDGAGRDSRDHAAARAALTGHAWLTIGFSVIGREGNEEFELPRNICNRSGYFRTCRYSIAARMEQELQ